MNNFNRFKHTFKRRRKSLLGFLFSDIGLITISLLLQLFLLWSAYANFLNNIFEIYLFVIVIEVITVLNILSYEENSDIKTTWIVVCFLMPVLGSLLYFYSKYDLLNYKSKKRLEQRFRESDKHIKENEEALNKAKQYPEVLRLHSYLKNNGSVGIYSNCETIYFKNGESMFVDMLQQLQLAKNFIFMEYFIIEEGVLWQQILDILVEKIKAGVEVKIVYDGSCDFKKLPRNYFKKLNDLGIQTVKFGTIYPFISLQFNYRDHRKITVIDGNVAYVGGLNIADEYANIIHPFSYWKDTGLRIKGEAVKSFTLMFLQMFSYKKETIDLSYLYATQEETGGNQGMVIPFADGPIDSYLVGETVYMDIINSANNYVYLMTPYLILDSNMEKTLKLAASKGVDVRIILPGVPDKKVLYLLAMSRCKRLMEAGIKVYSYQYGFLHAKQIISDDVRAVVGTINFDYRSLYHNYECGTYLYDTESLADIKNDFINTIGSSHLIKTNELDYLNKTKYRLAIGILKIFEPLL